ncbi:serine protease [Crossiella sp. CA-258035]|uniref:S1 family peptidase n=1 Tax=Crossiella sp. CA-258035 TaxID=2981138 RepID=UPI0024BD1CF1|nr:serine protease [Crossiella sp. CA-258035]WHT18513.1 serine protease [Crossiella sp. CA-258035]
MGAGTGDQAVGTRAEQPWRLRLCAEDGRVLGAGALLGGRYVLTCAHVLPGPEVLVDLSGHGGREPLPARVVEDQLAPLEEDGTGDLALLELAGELPAAWGARLRDGRLAPGRPVAAYGFPVGAPHGMWARAELSRAAGPGAEWVQLDALQPGNRVRLGFSGAGVLDEASGDVVGLVVSEYSAEGSVVAWMQPVRTIARYLPVVTEWVDRAPLPPVRLPELDGWLPHRGPGDVLVVITGEAGSARSEALLALAARLGSALVVIDVAGRTAAEAARLIAERTGQPPAGGMTVVLVGVDASAEPQALVTEVLNPLAERGAAVVAGYRAADSPSLAAIRAPGTVSGAQASPPRTDTLGARIAALAALEADVRRLWGEDGPRFAGEPDPPDRASRLRPWLSAVRRLPEAERGPRLAECAPRVDRALRKATEARNRLLVRRQRLRELRGLVQAYQRMAAEHGLAEDTGLDARYREALRRTMIRPCVLAEAEAAVQDYLRAVVRLVRDD